MVHEVHSTNHGARKKKIMQEPGNKREGGGGGGGGQASGRWFGLYRGLVRLQRRLEEVLC